MTVERGVVPPLVSAVIPARDAERFVADAIDSVLAQSYEPIECVVVDDGSTDETARVATTKGVRVISQPNRGVSAARNRGAAEARGELLAFLDADDVWLPQRVERLAEALRTGYDAALSATRVVDAELRRRISEIRMDRALSLRSILLGEVSPVSTSSNLLIRREAFAAADGFDERLTTAADWGLLVQLVQQGRVAYVDEPLTLYRRHAGNMSRSIGPMERDMRLVYDELFAHEADLPELQGIRRRAYARLHRMIAGSYWADSDLRGFARNAVASLRSHPAELAYFAAMPIRRLRGRRTPLD